MQKRLFETPHRVFFDPAVRQAPKSKKEYLAAEHVTVVYEPKRALDLDQWMASKGIERQFRVMVPALLQKTILKELASTEVPFTCPKLPMYLIWHLRHQHDAAHKWLRGLVEGIAREVVGK